MKRGRLALVDGPEFDYCDRYHCAGDCGQPHNQAERSDYIKHALATFDALGRDDRAQRRAALENTRAKAKDAL
jgi:hypothetical protein